MSDGVVAVLTADDVPAATGTAEPGRGWADGRSLGPLDHLPGGGGLIVTTVVADPEYLTTELVMSTQFKKEASRGAWNPRPCDIAPPLRGPAPTAANPFAAAASRQSGGISRYCGKSSVMSDHGALDAT
jgi:hypothetical protein